MSTTMDPNDLTAMKEYAGINQDQTEISSELYETMKGMAKKINGGTRGMFEMFIYVIFLVLFASLYFEDSNLNDTYSVVVPGPADAPLASIVNTVKKTTLTVGNTIYTGLCGLGIVLCLIRIIWGYVFVAKSTLSRSLEFAFVLIMWGAFMGALIISAGVKNQINDVLPAYTENKSVTTALKAMQKTNNTQLLYVSIGFVGTSIFTIYNIYEFWQRNEIFKRHL